MPSQRHCRDYPNRKQWCRQPAQHLCKLKTDIDRQHRRLISSGSSRKYTSAACETIRTCRANSPAAENSSNAIASPAITDRAPASEATIGCTKSLISAGVQRLEQIAANRVKRSVCSRHHSQPRLQPFQHLLVALVRRPDRLTG